MDLLTVVLPVLAAAMLARPADAHIVPIPPSLCSFGTIDLELPAARVTTSAAVPSAATKLRIVYDPNASVVHACPTGPDTGSDCGDSVPYGFVLDGSPGALALPSRFSGLMESSGDVVLDDLPVSLTLGAATANVPVTLTTGLVAAGGTVVEGTPLQGLGTWMLVGVIAGDSLPPPLTGAGAPARRGVPAAAGAGQGPVRPSERRRRAPGTDRSRDDPAPHDGDDRPGGSAVAVARIDAARGPRRRRDHRDGGRIGGLQGSRRRQVGTSDDGRTTVTARGRATTRLNLHDRNARRADRRRPCGHARWWA